jgi:voltage-gated potassium channel
VSGTATHSLRERVWDLLEVVEDPESGKASWDWVDVLLLVLIVLNVAAVILETVQSLKQAYGVAFFAFEVFSVAVFSVEYSVRLWACTADPRYSERIAGRIRYASSFYGVIDVLAIAPFYAAMLLPVGIVDLRILRVLRLMRFVRVLKIGRYSQALDRLKRVYSARRADLGVVVGGVVVLLVLVSSLMYHVENSAQPDKFSSIPAAMWWGISTLTTVGYGDMAPITPLGKLLGGVVQLLGIALFALPAAILAAGYEEEIQRRRAESGVCHVCGRPLDSSGDGG